jgi:toxin ParE1/3/4
VRVYWTRESLDDRRAIFEWIEADSPRAAIELDELIEERAGSLSRPPNLGKPGRVDGTRELVFHRNYLLVYEIVNEQVWILRVLNASRMWPVHDESSGA